ncbi:MAG: hypothetical protein ACYSU0_23410, partial [Planctomycetota bacterium]
GKPGFAGTRFESAIDDLVAVEGPWIRNTTLAELMRSLLAAPDATARIALLEAAEPRVAGTQYGKLVSRHLSYERDRARPRHGR